MLWSTHTHSGQFCTHATSTLREVILRALSLGLTTICLTEHIPRHPADFYPGEETHPLVLTHGDLFAVFAAYHTEACALRDEFADRIQVLVGFEGEWISSSRRTEGVMEELRSKYEFDLWLGSVHHVAGVPIDFTQGEYDRARDMCGGNDEGLAERYFDEQLEMLRGEPPVVAHFDLVRLLAGRKDGDWRGWKGVWERIVRNLKVAKGYGGVLEVNSAALRKGLEDVYPRREVLEEWRGMGGRLTISDDSHGVGQLCTNYGRALECVERAGFTTLWCPKVSVVGSVRSLEWQDVEIARVKNTLRSSTSAVS